MADKRKLIILNDDADLVEMMVTVLTEAGFEVASSITRDLAAVVSAAPDVILLDCPPGEEKEIVNFSQRLRLTANVAHVPILLGTSSLRHLEPALLRDKLIMVLIRPYGVDELLQAIETLINESDQRRRKPT